MIEHLTAGAIAKWGITPAAVLGAALLDPAFTAPAVVAVVGLFGTVLMVRQQRSEKKVDANGTLIDQLQEQLDTERARGDTLEGRLGSVSNELGEVKLDLTIYRIGTVTLTSQLVSLGQAPSWQPPTKETNHE